MYKLWQKFLLYEHFLYKLQTELQGGSNSDGENNNFGGGKKNNNNDDDSRDSNSNNSHNWEKGNDDDDAEEMNEPTNHLPSHLSTVPVNTYKWYKQKHSCMSEDDFTNFLGQISMESKVGL